MFKLFKKKSALDRLEEKYEGLLQEAFKLSTVNRKLSDQKTDEAHQVLKEIEAFKSK